MTRDDVIAGLARHAVWARGTPAPAVLSSIAPREAWTNTQRAAVDAWDPGDRLSLDGADLSGLDLSGLDLRHVGMVGANLTGADLSTCDLRHANMTGARLEGARLSRTTIDGTTRLRGVDIGAGLSLRSSTAAIAAAMGHDPEQVQHSALIDAVGRTKLAP